MHIAAVALLAASAALLPDPSSAAVATLRHRMGRGLLEAEEGEGGSPSETFEMVVPWLVCTSRPNSTTFSQMRDAHINVVSSFVAAFCDPDFDGVVGQAVKNASEFAVAFASALVETQSECVSMGNAFECSSAAATADAWARATAEAHFRASALALRPCSCLDVDPLSFSFTFAEIFRNLTAEVLARAQTTACAQGDQESFARA